MTPPAHRRSLALAAALLAAGVIGPRLAARAQLGPPPLPSPVVFPTQRLPLSFSHVEHLTKEKLGCDFCHEDAATSTSAADRLLPTEEHCAICHPIERGAPTKAVAPGKPDAACRSCHPGFAGAGPPPSVVIPAPNLRFNHKVHAERGVRCARCHGDLAALEVGLATRAQLPRMPLCLECHDGRAASARCTTCHPAEAGGRVRTHFPQGDLVPSGVLRGDAHDLRWARTRHARGAATDEAYCMTCHRRRDCQDCHDGVLKPMSIHDGDYVARHAVDARRNEPDCSSCHRLQTFCTGCHARSGVAMDPRTAGFDRRSRPRPQPAVRPRHFHPEGWWAPSGRSGNHHSFEAQRNLRSCVSCHREETCLECHSERAGAAGVDPHPTSWRGSARCEALLRKNTRVCLRCHVGGSSCDP